MHGHLNVKNVKFYSIIKSYNTLEMILSLEFNLR